MKLTTDQVGAIERQTGAIPIPDDNPASEALTEVFGEHTFYADQSGLHVLEPVDAEELDGTHAEVIQIAEWTTDAKDELQPIEPQRSGAVLGLDEAGEAAIGADSPED
ncbi:hypothetical protein L2D14_04055 [Thalassospiraceae bacterium LMO-JJ14]|nr:hypothetical protein L2D14_04055 [Thalassospiraceae bacterium LMO-JJ14]